MTNNVGRVLGTEDAHPLEFWVGVAEDSYLQLDDIVAVDTEVPDRGEITLYGVVDIVRAKYEGAKFDSDVFHIAEGTFPAGIATAAHVSVTRVEPEVFVPPQPGQQARRAVDAERETALYFDQMKNRFPLGLSRDGQPVWGNLDFLDGTRGAHVNISGISGVATKTSYALFLLHGLFNSEDSQKKLGPNTRAVIFNLKGEDLLHLDRPNARLRDSKLMEQTSRSYEALGLKVEPFQSVSLWAPPDARAIVPTPSVNSRSDDKIRTFYWSIRRFCEEGLMPFLFAEADRETSQLQFAVTVVVNFLQRKVREASGSAGKGWVEFDGKPITTFESLVDYITEHEDEVFPEHLRIARATVHAFVRRLRATAEWAGHLIRKTDSPAEEEQCTLNWRTSQLNVIHISGLHDVAMRFVVGVTLKRLMTDKLKEGTKDPVVFVVLDELNKYAPREGWSPIKETVLDIAERGRSLGVILIGAQQTASEVERRVIGNPSFKVVGRLDSAESQRAEYGFLSEAARARSYLLKPGSMFVHQPEIPTPLLVQFPFPAWATNQDEVDAGDLRSKWR